MYWELNLSEPLIFLNVFGTDLLSFFNSVTIWYISWCLSLAILEPCLLFCFLVLDMSFLYNSMINVGLLKEDAIWSCNSKESDFFVTRDVKAEQKTIPLSLK